MTGQTRFPLSAFTLLLFAALFSACASAGSQTGGDGSGITIRVHNDVVPSRNVSISAVTDGGTPVRLGSLVAGEEQTFTYRPIVNTGTYRLVADLPGPGGSMASEPISFVQSEEGIVTWQLSTNNVIVR